MKKILCFAFALVLASSCDNIISFKVDYDVNLDKSNTYIVGEPVRFNFSGDVDNLVFYSGEVGHQYKYKDRLEVPVSDIESIKMTLRYQPRWGQADGLDVYVSGNFEGLSGTDADSDRKIMQNVVDSGFAGWTKLTYNEGAHGEWTSQVYDISSYVENFSLAFHWHPKYNGSLAQRTYWLDGWLELDFPGAQSAITMSDMDFVSLLMNPELDAYNHTGNGSVIFTNPVAPIILQGVGATDLDFPIEGWCVCRPMALNKVSADRGVSIKNLQNYMDSFEYVFNEAGTYVVTFVGRNVNVDGFSEQVRQMTVMIHD